eukprot:TRINITY_DN3531_c1_g1_i1.p1 TRINITY_DN3531_c1_g1~~TRINITY_DN3531_c1_g1_i1.p1  ORF type:complete len:824 (+),score=378.63 TRINITY_DN3531_c1_g1_i1:164-2635(+)
MVVMVNSADPPIVDVVLVIEDTALGSTSMADLKTHYILPTLEHFNGGPVSELEFASLNCSSSFTVVPFYASDCLPSPPAKIMGPFTSIKKILTVFDRLEFSGGQGETHSSGQEGLASALQVLKEVEQRRGGDIATSKHILYICNSALYDMPVLDNTVYHGRTLDDLAMDIRDKNIYVSVVAPRKLPALAKLYEKCGGDLKSAKEKNYAKDPRHLVLLRGYGLQERPVTPKPLAPVPSVSPAPLTSLPMSQFPGQTRATTPGQLPSQSPDNIQLHMARQQQQQANTFRPLGLGQQQQQVMGQQQGVMAQQQQLGQQQQQGMGQQQQQAMGQQSVLGQQVMGQQQQQGLPQTQPSILNQVLNKAPGQQVRLPGQADNTLRKILANPPQNIQPVNLGGLLSRPPGPSGPVMPNMQQQQMGQQPQQVMGQQQQQMRPNMLPGQERAREREKIWIGELEWQEKVKDGPGDQKISHSVACSVSTSKENGVPEVKPDNWPGKLIMQLIPKSLVQTIGGQYFRNSKSVLFHPNDCESLEALTKVMGTGFAGCVHFTGSCDIKVLILLYSNDKKAYLGFIPNDQISFVDRIRTVIQEQKGQQQQQQIGGQQMRVGMGPGGQMVQQGQQVINMMPGGQQVPQQVSMGMMTSQQQQQQTMSQSVMLNPQQQQLQQQQQQQQQGMMGQQQQQVMGQQRMMMGPSGGMVGQQQIIRGQQVMGQQTQYVRMSGGQGMPQQRMMQGQNMTPGLRQILQQPGMMGVQQQGGILQQQQMGGVMQQQQQQTMQPGMQQQQGMMMQQRMGGPVPVQGGMVGAQGVVGQQQQQNDPMLRELLN